MYYNTRTDTFTASMYVYPNLDSSMLDAPRRFKVLEDGAISNNARIFIEIQNGSLWKGFMGGLTGEDGTTDIELIGGLTYR